MNASIALLLAISHLLGLSHSFQPTIHMMHKKSSLTKLNARPPTNSNAIHKNILTRRTVNNFATALPPNWETSLHKAIKAAIHAPNRKRTEPWRFYLLGHDSIEKICRINADIVSSAKGAEAGEAKYKRWKDIPGWLVVTCVTDGDHCVMNDRTGLAREDYAACCCAVQNLCLSLHSSGIGTKWTTGGVNFDERFANAVGFEYGKEYTVGTVWFGEAVGTAPVAPVKKYGVDDVLKRVP